MIALRSLQSTADAIKTATHATKVASKRAIQKTAEATGDLTGNKIAHKTTSASKSSKKLHSQNENELEITNKRYTYIQKKDNKLLTN